MIASTLDRHSFCGYDCVVLNCNIGSFCSIASEVVLGGSRHPMEYVSTSPVFLSHRDSVKAKFARHEYRNMSGITVGHDVWIGNRAMIKSGVTIGSGSVIGMGAVVTKDVPPYAIWAGNPGRLIRYRFTPEVIAALMVIQWWHFDDDKLARLGPHITSPERFIEACREDEKGHAHG